MMRRFLFLLLISALLLAACSPLVTVVTSVPAYRPTAAATGTPVPPTAIPVPTATPLPDLGVDLAALKGVEVTAWESLGGIPDGGFAQMAAEFTGENPWGVKVTVKSWPNLNTLSGEVGRSLGTDGQPDVVLALPEQSAAWQDSLVDLTTYVIQPEIGLAGDVMSGAVWEQSLAGTKRAGVPLARSARFLFYNVSFAKELGFDAAPLTAEDLRKQACAANAWWKADDDPTNDGFGGLAMDVNSNWQTPYAWLAASGGSVVKDGNILFSSPENEKALGLIADLRQSGCAWQPVGLSNFEHLMSRRALFISGSIGDFAGQNLARATEGAADEWTVIAFPGEKSVIVAYGPDFSILKSSPQRQAAAWLFIRWMLEEKNQVKWSHSTGMLPVVAGAITVLQTDTATPPQVRAALKLLPLAVVYPQTARWGLADKILADGFLAYGQGFPNLNLKDLLSVMDSTLAEVSK